MRIAQVSPLYESVPPRLYGGTERVVAYLTEALLEAGHDVTLFASGDSRTGARLRAGCPEALRLSGQMPHALLWHYLQLQDVIDRSDDFDLIHFHTDYLHFPIAPLLRAPHLLTLHGRLDIPELKPLYRRYAAIPATAITRAQQGALPEANWVGVVHHGLPERLYAPGAGDGGYFAFLGRLSPEKRVDRAIEIARRVGVPIRIAAKIDAADRAYFERVVAPLLELDGVEFIGEIDETQKAAFLGGARALLFPIDWPEPFGLVLIEALACGTPVVAFGHGSVPEIVEHGTTGFIVDDVDAAVAAARTVDTISLDACRAAFERRFSARRAARDYVAVYEAVAARWREGHARHRVHDRARLQPPRHARLNGAAGEEAAS